MRIRLIWEHEHHWKDFSESPEFIGQRCTHCKAERSVVVVHAAGWKPDKHVIRRTPKLERQPGECDPPIRPCAPSAMDRFPDRRPRD